MGYTGSWVWDVQTGAPVYWSAEMCRIHGRDPAHGPPSVEDHRALHTPKDWSIWLAAVQKCVEDKSEVVCDFRLQLPGGIIRDVHITGHPIAGAVGEVTEIIGSAVLITEPGPPTIHDNSANGSFRELIDLIPTLAWSSRPDGTADFFNRGWLDYTGLRPEQAVDRGWTVAIHPHDLNRMVEYWQSVLASPGTVEIEARLRRFDGEYPWFLFRARPQHDEAGHIIKWYGTNTDIDDRKRAEVALRDSGRKLHHLVETIPAMIWRGTNEGELDYLNQRSIDFLGHDAEGLAGGRWLELVHPDQRDATVERWLASVPTGAPYKDVYQLRRADGEYRWIESVGEPFRNGEGRIVRWYGLLADIDDRKRAEDALRESERELRQLVDSVPGMIAVADAEGQHEYANQQTLDYTGTTLEESRGLGFVQTIHPEDQPLFINEWLRSNQLRRPMDINHRWRRFDGVYRWFHVRIDPLLDKHGRVIRWYGLLTDIDDRKRAEDALRESELNFRLILDSIPRLVCTMTPRGEVELVNRQVLDYFGRTLEELRNRAFIGAVHQDDLDRVIAKWRHSIETGAPDDIEHRIRRADDVFRWFQVRGLPLKNSQQQIVRWYILLTDIEEGKRSEEAVRASEIRLRLITETIPAIVTSRDAAGKLDYVNQRLVDYTGRSVEEILASRSDLIHPDDRESLAAAAQNAREIGGHYELDYRMRGADGVYRWFRVREAPLLQRDGEVLRWYAVITDIDNEKGAREALLRSQARLARMSQITTVAELSASIAHEVNQPLAAVLANGHACLAWLSANPPHLERVRFTAERIIRDTNSAAEVVRRMRALFKQAPPAKVMSDINDTIGEVLRIIGNELRESGVAIETDLAPGLPMIVADKVQIQQTLINLGHNAIGATATVMDRPRILSLTSRLSGSEILVQVGDNGCGVENPALIFDPFFTTKPNGMGMGLTICRSIIEAHDGRLWSTPNEGAGTSFSFSLPVQTDGAS
jgi:PAS domain S-box-containing protein